MGFSLPDIPVQNESYCDEQSARAVPCTAFSCSARFLACPLGGVSFHDIEALVVIAEPVRIAIGTFGGTLKDIPGLNQGRWPSTPLFNGLAYNRMRSAR
jgi:hypothetical protein